MSKLFANRRGSFASKYSRPFMAGLLSLGSCGTAFALDLTVTVQNIQNDTGQIMVGLYDSDDGFPQTPKLSQAIQSSQRDASGRLQVVFNGVPEGTYAVSAVHDKDSNGKLSTNMLSMPTEPYGFSGKGSSAFGPPNFKDVAIVLDSGVATVDISLK